MYEVRVMADEGESERSRRRLKEALDCLPGERCSVSVVRETLSAGERQPLVLVAFGGAASQAIGLLADSLVKQLAHTRPPSAPVRRWVLVLPEVPRDAFSRVRPALDASALAAQACEEIVVLHASRRPRREWPQSETMGHLGAEGDSFAGIAAVDISDRLLRHRTGLAAVLESAEAMALIAQAATLADLASLRRLAVAPPARELQF